MPKGFADKMVFESKMKKDGTGQIPGKAAKPSMKSMEEDRPNKLISIED